MQYLNVFNVAKTVYDTQKYICVMNEKNLIFNNENEIKILSCVPNLISNKKCNE